MNNPIGAPKARAMAMARALFATGLLLLVAGAALPAHSQSAPDQPAPDQPAPDQPAPDQPAWAAAFTPTPSPTPILPPSQPFLQAPSQEGTVTGSTNGPLGMPTFTWAVPVNALISHIQVSNTPGFSTVLIDTDTEATSYTPTAVWPDGLYYWRVKAGAGPANKRVWGEYSAIWTFMKDWSDQATIRPALLQPPPEAVRKSFGVEDFAWEALPGAAGYLLEIAVDAQFSNVAYKAETLKAQHTPSLRLGSGLYYWRVTPFAYAASAAGRVYAAPSESRRFSIDWTAPPVQLTPENSIATPFAPRFQWQAVEGARSYQIQVSTDSGFNPTSTTTYNTANTDFTPNANLSNDKEYYWRVKAIDQNNNETSWSSIRSFRTQWNFAPKLLTPRNNQIQLSYPFFSWEPVPGAEQYQIQINKSENFQGTVIEDTKIFNVTTYTQPDWNSVPLNSDAYWRVRAVDASGNYTPWSETRAFQTAYTVIPNLVYPPQTYQPDTTNLPVHRPATIAWPVFVWDTAHEWMFVDQNGNGWLENEDFYKTLGPDYFELTVDDEPGFVGDHNLFIRTHTLGAAPVLDGANPQAAFSRLADGVLYYWRVEAFRNGVKIGLPGVNHTGEFRYHHTPSELAVSDVIAPTHPRHNYQGAGAPPVLGWQPVVSGGQAAYNYHVQISKDRDFVMLVDEAYPQFVNYVPWQGRLDPMPSSTYWWRVRAESSPGVEMTPWSEPRSFSLAVDLLTGNINEWPAPNPADMDFATIFTPTKRYDPSLSLVATSTGTIDDSFHLRELRAIIDRSITTNLNWVFAFDVNPAPTEAVRYAIYVDNNHLAAARPCGQLAAGEPDAGGTGDPTGAAIASHALYAPEYVVSLDWNGSTVTATYYRWNGVKWNPTCAWAPPIDIRSIGGDVWYDPVKQVIQVLVPYTALGGADDDFSGSLAVSLLSTNALGDGIRDSIPPQGVLPGSTPNTVDNPVFLSDMLLPLFPFDTPLTNPIVFYDMPPLRWRMPIFDSVDGYQVQVARDERFSQVIETWETYEVNVWPFFALLPATFQSGVANADNESYYWRVRIRHEKTSKQGAAYDYGPWSPPQRFKLDSRTVGNPRLSTGSDVFMTPTFEWDRVEGAASYRLQVDDDVLFGSPLIDVGVDGTSYTPQEIGGTTALSSHVQYYWRVAMRRADNVLGAWTPTLPLDKNSVAPTPLWPLSSQPMTVTYEQPTFAWTAVLTPTANPRLAVPLYQLQVDNNEDFKSLEIDVATTATSYTPIKGKSLADGQWYWRVASYEATVKPGPFSTPQVFFKQYPQLVPVEPARGGNSDRTPRFTWLPAPGAATYQLEVAPDSGFQKPTKYVTANTTFTPVEARKAGVYFWRVRMIDHDGKEGPILPFQFNLGRSCYLPLITK